MFNIYTRSLIENSEVLAYADDLVLVITGNKRNISQKAQKELDKLTIKANNLDLEFSSSKSKILYFSVPKKTKLKKVKIGRQYLERVKEYKYLGVIIDEKITFGGHIQAMLARVNKKIGALKFLTNRVSGCSTNILINMYKSHIRPLVEYASSVWGGAVKGRLNPLEGVQHQFLCLCLGTSYRTARIDVLRETGMISLETRRKVSLLMNWKKHRGDDLIDQNLYGKGNDRFDAKKLNLYSRIKRIGVGLGFSTEELGRLDKEVIKRLLADQCYAELDSRDNRNSDEALFTKALTKLVVNGKRKREPDEPKYHRRKECMYRQARLGTLNLNSFAARLGSKRVAMCPNEGCVDDETRGNFLFYCLKYAELRMKYFAAKKVKNKLRQTALLSKKKFKGAVIGFSNEALATRGK